MMNFVSPTNETLLTKIDNIGNYKVLEMKFHYSFSFNNHVFKFIEVNFSVLIEISRFDQIFDFLVREVLSQILECLLQLRGCDEPVRICIKCPTT